jgi:phosphate transport system substrate-binding protein
MIGTEASSTAVSVTIKGRILFCHWHKKEAEELMKTNSDVSVTVVGGGSGWYYRDD